MRYLILLIASCAWGQQQSVLPVEDMKKEGALQAMQQMSDSKFSIYGGTVTGQISASSITNVTEICFLGGACQTSAASNLLSSNNVWTGSNTWTSTITTNGQIHNSSGTTSDIALAGPTWTNVTFDGIAIAGSTLTITTSGSSVVYHYTGTCRNDTNNVRTALGVYMDGSLVSPQTSIIGVVSMGGLAATLATDCSFSFYIRNPAAGTHSFYMAGRVGSNTGSLTDSNAIGQVWVEELK